MSRSDSWFLAGAVPGLCLAGVALADGAFPRFCGVSQVDYLARARWRAPALGAWMITATSLTAIAPHVVGRGSAPNVRSALSPIPLTLLLQVGLEGTVGAGTDRGYPLIGLVFSLWRLRQVARLSRAGRGAPAPRRLARALLCFWAANVVMLLVTVRGRSLAGGPAER